MWISLSPPPSKICTDVTDNENNFDFTQKFRWPLDRGSEVFINYDYILKNPLSNNCLPGLTPFIYNIYIVSG